MECVTGYVINGFISWMIGNSRMWNISNMLYANWFSMLLLVGIGSCINLLGTLKINEDQFYYNNKIWGILISFSYFSFFSFPFFLHLLFAYYA